MKVTAALATGRQEWEMEPAHVGDVRPSRRRGAIYVPGGGARGYATRGAALNYTVDSGAPEGRNEMRGGCLRATNTIWLHCAASIINIYARCPIREADLLVFKHHFYQYFMSK